MAEDKCFEYGYNFEYEYYYDEYSKLYIYKLTCEQFWPCVGRSKSITRARRYAYQNMLFNIKNNIVFDKEETDLSFDYEDEVENKENLSFDYNIEKTLKRQTQPRFFDRLDMSLKESRATIEEQQKEEEELTDSSFNSSRILGWNMWNDKVKKQYLDNELNNYNKESSLRVPVARPSTPIFGKPQILYNVKA